MYKSLIMKKQKSIRKNRVRNYIFALLSTIVCLVVQYLMGPIFGPTQYFLLFPVVFIVTALGGLGPGLVVILIGGLGANTFLVDPMTVDSTRQASAFISFSKFLIFAFSSLAGSWFIHLIQSKQEKLERDIDQLQESDKQFKILADSSPVLIWMTDTEKKMSWFNRNWREFTGFDLQSLISMQLGELVYPEDRDAVLRTFSDNYGDKKAWKSQFRLKRHDGAYRWLLCNAVPMYNDTEFVGFVGVCVDITDQKEAEQSIKNAVASRDHFLAVASHELKTPISSLTLQAQIFKKIMQKGDAINQEQVQKLADQITRQVFRLDRLIDDMLDNSRINSGKFNLLPEEFNLFEMTDEVIERMTMQYSHMKDKPVIISNVTPKEDATKFDGVWDKIKLDQVLTNLITNAIKYGKESPVEILLKDQGETVLIQVKDKGIGIEDSHRNHIFERFYRVHGPSDSGLGLGLFICGQIVKAHHGKIWVDSKKGEGSTFNVELPKQTESVSEDHYA